MCKFCNLENENGKKRLMKIGFNLGDFGKMTSTVTLSKYNDGKVNIQNDLAWEDKTLPTSEWYVHSDFKEIKYCPFCGRKFE